RVCEAFGLPILEVPGFEADDVIATLARQAVDAGYKVVVVTGDKDFLQLVSDDVLVLNPGREGSGATLYDRKTVEEKFGVPPERVVDVLSLVGDAAALARFVEQARGAGAVGLSLLRSTREPMRARIVGLALSREPGRAIYVPFDPAPLEAPSVLPRPRAMEILRPLLEDPAVTVQSARAKHDRILLGRLGVTPARLGFDAFVASYLLNPGRRTSSVEDLALEFLGERPKPMAGIVEGGAEGVSVAAAAQAAAQEADLVRRLAGPMTARLKEEGLLEIFETMEMPLV